jgi:uncharacterized membrane protein
MDNAPSRAPLVGLVLITFVILAVPIVGLTLISIAAAQTFSTGPLVPLLGFLIGNVIGWLGVRWLYVRERRRFNRA